MSDYDVIVAGGGHNGLVCAAYLARGGQRVAVLERRAEVGGIAEVLHTAGRLQAGVIARPRPGRARPRAAPARRAHDGAARGRPSAHVLGRSRAHGRGPARDRARPTPTPTPRFDAHLRELAGFVAEVQASTPPRLDRAALGDAAAGLRLARAYRRLGPRAARELTRVLPMAVADLVGEWFSRRRRAGRAGRPRDAVHRDGAVVGGHRARAPRRLGRERRRRRRPDGVRPRRARGARARARRGRPGRPAPRCAPRPRWRGCWPATAASRGSSSQAASRSPRRRWPARSTRRRCSPAGSTRWRPARGCAGGRATSARPGRPPGST